MKKILLLFGISILLCSGVFADYWENEILNNSQNLEFKNDDTVQLFLEHINKLNSLRDVVLLEVLYEYWEDDAWEYESK